jgi:DNA-binding NarL/FixJ family response regulator
MLWERISGCPMSASENEWSKVLSPREHEVALQIARGLSNREVARVPGLRAGTVKCHVHNILQKLGETRRYSLIAQLQGRAIVAPGRHTRQFRRK